MRLGIVTILLTSASLFAQAPDTLWTRAFGGPEYERCNALVTTPSGGYLLVGEAIYYTGIQPDFLAIYVDSSGNEIWNRRYGGTADDRAQDVVRTSDNCFAIAGYGGILGPTGRQMLLLKINANGDTLWTRYYGNIATEQANAIIETNDGGYLLAGWKSALGGEEQAFIVKTNSTGQMVWAREYGGLGAEFIEDVVETNEGDFVFLGRSNSFGGAYRAYVVKIDSSGNEIWTSDFGTVEQGALCYSILENLNSNYVVAGFIPAQSMLPSGALLMEISYSGDSLWAYMYGNQSVNVELKDIALTSTGGYIFTGSYWANPGHQVIVGNTDENGTLLWSKTIGGSLDDFAESIAQTNDGGFVIGGFGNSYGISNDDHQAYLIRLAAEFAVTYPNGGEEFQLLSTDTTRWTGIGFEGDVSIQLNRNYPSGSWEPLVDSTANDGEFVWNVSGPPSDACRIRVCAIEDTFCDISDNNFSIVSSGGFLTMVRSSQPNTPVTTWNSGIIECQQIASQWFRFKNFGNSTLVFLPPLEPTSAAFSRTTTCAGFVGLAANEISACSVRVSFSAPQDGEFTDLMLIESNAVNIDGNYVEITLFGEQISTPAAPEVVITSQGEDAILYWSAVDTSVGGCAVSGLRYLVFYSPTSGGPFYYHGGTTDTTYTHVWAVTYAPAMFYQVVAVKAPALLLSELEAGMEMGEVMEIVDGVKRETE